MSDYTADVIVVGGGVMGCAVAYHLAKDGQRVLLLEQFAVGHAYGSSHGPSRIIRLAYDGADYVQLARAAYALWQDLEAESGESLMLKVGGFDFGPPDAFMLAGIGAMYQTLGVPFEAVDRDEIVCRFPQFNLPEDTMGYYQPDYSLLAADRCVATLAAEARRYGATLRENEPAHEIRATASGVAVRTEQGIYTAERLILSAGSWMRPLLQQLDLALPLTVTKEQLAFFKPPDPTLFMPDRFPLFIQRFPGTTSLGSGFPIFGHTGVKMMLDRIGPETDPDDPDCSIDQPRLDRLRAYVAGVLPGLGNDIVEAVTCRYTMTPDEDFVIDRHPAHPQIVIASPCSGHGFKFGVVIGRILADLAVRGTTEHPIGRFRLDRPALKNYARGDKLE
ncbi:MAG: N-methyl-L-tryptophan oxidase [Chloroflexi bacterium]|nr:N-methyl-L-tryptophan oxidase [Chloroflexota bacterium]